MTPEEIIREIHRRHARGGQFHPNAARSGGTSHEDCTETLLDLWPHITAAADRSKRFPPRQYAGVGSSYNLSVEESNAQGAGLYFHAGLGAHLTRDTVRCLRDDLTAWLECDA